GNHEEDGTNYLHYLHLPGKERWYSYDVGPVHVLSLDYRYEKKTDEQFQFAKQDLLSAQAPWKIVFLHFPVFNIGGHNTGWGHAAYLPLFHEAKVDLVMAGHSHIYERFRPIAGQTGADHWPITYITTGGGGAPLYTTYAHPALLACATTNHYVVIEATPTRLKGHAFTTNQVVLDTFELKKRWGQPPASYFAQAYPEEVLKLVFDAAASLNANLATTPTTNSPAQAMFTIKPMKTTRFPVELEIGLTYESALYYQIEGGPLRVATPTLTQSNKIAWAAVRATGKKKIETQGQDKTLSPSLIFQAKVSAGAGDTLAYGQRCKVSNDAAKAVQKLAEAQPPKLQ
ncbi:MAG: metallophosphoesterase, partial [candidate division Zixibacteria bacterium]|nr:metallophosphoesterase [candidate division Zixibacteria bacterium]